MNYIKKLRIYIGAFLLKQKIKNKKRTPVICNLKQAKDIGIVFNSANKNDIKTIKKFESFCKQSNIKLDILGYCNEKKSEDTLIGDSNHHYINVKDFNWFFQPKNSLIEHFSQTPYDILINLYQEEEFPIEYILKCSIAKFKVGCSHLNNAMHDMMIDVTKKQGDSDYLYEQIMHYLDILNN